MGPPGSTRAHPVPSKKPGLHAVQSCSESSIPFPALINPVWESDGMILQLLLSCHSHATLKPPKRSGPALPSPACREREVVILLAKEALVWKKGCCPLLALPGLC